MFLKVSSSVSSGIAIPLPVARLAQMVLGELSCAVTRLADVVALFGLHAFVAFVFRVLTLIRVGVVPFGVSVAVELIIHHVLHWLFDLFQFRIIVKFRVVTQHFSSMMSCTIS